MVTLCFVCGRLADARIPEGRVCRLHAIEFYTELLAYARVVRTLQALRAPAPSPSAVKAWAA